VNILINDVPISFELEQESNAGEVMDGLVRWLGGSGHRVERLEVNGELVPVEDAEAPWRSLELSSVETLAVRAASVHQLEIEQLETVINYCDLLRRVAVEGSAEQFSDVLTEISHITTAIDRIAPSLSGMLEEPSSPAASQDPEVRQRLSTRAGQVAQVLRQRQRELLDPEHELLQILGAIETILPAFEEVPVQLQSGREKQALELVARFAELAGRLLRVLPVATQVNPDLTKVTVQEKPLMESVAGLATLFGDLEGAMQRQDLVLVGDLMEYELLPYFSELSEAMRR
jgi:hypothetical protein